MMIEKKVNNLLPQDGEVFYFPQLFTADESKEYFASLQNNINWKQEPIKIFGKEVMQPRLTAWYGDAEYSYSGITMQPSSWTETLIQIKTRIETLAGVTFNSALLNQYRNENDSMGWHRDNEKELGKNPIIGSVSFGATRKFQLKHYFDKKLKTSIDMCIMQKPKKLSNSSITRLIMAVQETENIWTFNY